MHPIFTCSPCRARRIALPAHAQHAHGEGRLDVVIDKDSIAINLELPLDAAVGFERAPRNEREKAALAADGQDAQRCRRIVHADLGRELHAPVRNQSALYDRAPTIMPITPEERDSPWRHRRKLCLSLRQSGRTQRHRNDNLQAASSASTASKPNAPVPAARASSG
jgi:hypothetical protein